MELDLEHAIEAAREADDKRKKPGENVYLVAEIEGNAKQ